jgi:hypothetical protein
MKYLLSIVLAVTVLHATAQHAVPPTKEISIFMPGKKQPVVIDIPAIKKMQQDNLGDVAIKNHKGEVKNTQKNVKGVLLKSLLDKAPIEVNKPKEYSELYITLIASDGYRNVYSWNEIFNTEIGNHLYIITSVDGKDMEQADGVIMVISLGDTNTGLRHLKGLERIEVKKVE